MRLCDIVAYLQIIWAVIFKMACKGYSCDLSCHLQIYLVNRFLWSLYPTDNLLKCRHSTWSDDNCYSRGMAKSSHWDFATIPSNPDDIKKKLYFHIKWEFVVSFVLIQKRDCYLKRVSSCSKCWPNLFPASADVPIYIHSSIHSLAFGLYYKILAIASSISPIWQSLMLCDCQQASTLVISGNFDQSLSVSHYVFALPPGDIDIFPIAAPTESLRNAWPWMVW